jgi:hypothetical protein
MTDRGSLDDKTGRYKITEPTDSGVDELDQYVFVIRDRISQSLFSKSLDILTR